MAGNNGKQNRKESYTNKYQKHIACSYGYKLVCFDDKFSKPFKTYLGENTVYNFINSIIKESKYCSYATKKYFNKELVTTKEENSTKCWICDNDYVDNDFKLRDHCHITGKYRGSAHCDSQLIMQELGKFNLKISVIPNGLEKYVSFTINNKLSSIDSFQFLSFSVDTLVKNVNEDNFKYLSQEFEKNKLDLLKQKGFYLYEYMSDFEKFKEELPSKEKLYSSLTNRKINDREYEHVLNVWNLI